MPDALAAPPCRAVPNPGIDAGANDGAYANSQSPNGSIRAERRGKTSETPAWIEPPLPNGARRTYLTSGGSAAVAVAFLVFVALLLGYFSSATSWARW
jgi:hypothetical protein